MSSYFSNSATGILSADGGNHTVFPRREKSNARDLFMASPCDYVIVEPVWLVFSFALMGVIYG